jgi:hypothetical protein
LKKSLGKRLAAADEEILLVLDAVGGPLGSNV